MVFDDSSGIAWELCLHKPVASLLEHMVKKDIQPYWEAQNRVRFHKDKVQSKSKRANRTFTGSKNSFLGGMNVN